MAPVVFVFGSSVHSCTHTHTEECPIAGSPTHTRGQPKGDTFIFARKSSPQTAAVDGGGNISLQEHHSGGAAAYSVKNT